MLRDLQIIVRQPTGSLLPQIKTPMGVVSGSENLVQRITKKILTLRGTNSFYADVGSQFYNLFGVFDQSQIESIKSMVPIFVNDLATQMRQEQFILETSGQILDDNEYLVDISLISVEFDEMFGGWIIELKVTTKASDLEIRIP